MVAEEGIQSVNLYDLFANVIPGMSFVFGLTIAFEPAPTIGAILSVEHPAQFNIAYLILLLSIAFVIGQLLQAFGSRHDGDHGFSNFVRKIKGEDIECRHRLTDFGDEFWEHCEDRFDLSEDFDDYGRLFKLILSRLESSGQNRALRMQALYLFARGVWVAAWALTLLFLITYFSIEYDYLPVNWTTMFRAPEVILFGAGVTWVTRMIVASEREQFEKDWIQYTITEFSMLQEENESKDRHQSMGE